MEQFKLFSAEKSEVIESLCNLKTIVSKLDEVGIDISDDINKIESAIKDVENEILRIALIGAFSDGKTSVIAGWLGHIMDNMKIDTNESSDKLAIYHPENLPDKCEIVDTPGLFGDKEKADEGNRIIQCGDITKKYLSEAHLVFYVVDATNPLKDSHKDIVKWILRDLNKLSSTIFVINKMDEVADLRDTEDFNNQSIIKKENLLGKLSRFVDLSDDEKKHVNIVCLSSNPNNRGLEFWFDKKDIYEERSRINVLKQITSSILDSTTKQQLIRKTGMDVITDIVTNKIVAAEEEFAALNLYADNFKSDIRRIEEDIANGRREIISAKEDLFNELNDIEKQLLGKVRTLSSVDILGFLEDEIGYSKDDIGYKLRLKIGTVSERCFQQSSNIMSGISTSIESQLESSESFINSVSSSALKASSKALGVVNKMPVNTIKNGVFVARDAIAKITGTVFKFKPWGATKIAANISKWAGPIGAGIQVITDVIDKVEQKKAEEKLKETQNKISDMIKDNFKVLYDILSDNFKVFENFAPQLTAFEDILNQQKQGLVELLQKRQLLAAIKDDFFKVYSKNKAIEAEYAVY